MSRACRVRSVYSGLSQTQHGVSDIACSVQICANTFNSTTNTSESTMISTAQTTTGSTELRCHKGIDISYQYADSFGFVRQEAAELGEAPAMHFSFSSCCFSDVGQVLQDYLGHVRIDTIRDDLLGYVVVSPCSEPFLSARNGFEQPFAASSAFSLECASEVSVFPIHSIGILRRMESCGAGHCRVAYAKVDADGFRNANSCVWCFSFECEAEPVMTKFIGHEQSFSDLPEREVLQEAMRNVDRNCNTMVQYAQRQEEVSSIRIHTSRPVEVISDRCMRNNRLRASFLDDTTTLFDASYGDLSWQRLPEFSIDVWLQRKAIRNAECPCRIDAVLQSDSVCSNQFVECNSLWQSDSCGCSHSAPVERTQLFKANQYYHLKGEKSQFIHPLKRMASLAQVR